MSKMPIFLLFLSVGNLKRKLKWFFKPKLKLNFFLLNYYPVHHPRVRLLKVEAVPQVRLHQLLVRRITRRAHGLHRLPRD